MSHPVNLILEAFDMLRLLHELVLRDHERELGLLMIRIKKLSDDAVDILLDGEAEGEPDAHSFDRIAVIDNLCQHEQFMIPFAEVLFRGQLGSLRASCSGI